MAIAARFGISPIRSTTMAHGVDVPRSFTGEMAVAPKPAASGGILRMFGQAIANVLNKTASATVGILAGIINRTPQTTCNDDEHGHILPQIGDMVKGRVTEEAKWQHGELVIIDARGKMFVRDTTNGVVFAASSVIVTKTRGGKLYSPPKKVVWLNREGVVHPHRRLPKASVGLAARSAMGKLRAVLEFRRRKGYRVAMAAVDSPPPAAVGEAEFARAAAAAAAVDSGGAPPP